MNNEAIREILNDLFSHLERLETQSEAILQFLKEKKRVTDKQLAPYLEQAGNASSVRWRAARVRIEHLLSPEHPEAEMKLGKQPELQEDSPRADLSDAVLSEDKRTELSDTGLHDKENSAPADALQAHPADGKADKLEEKSESGRGDTEQAAEDKHEQKSDSENFRHPTEVTEPLAEQEGAEPAAKLSSKDKKSNQEAA
jgi:hypothetical protein